MTCCASLPYFMTSEREQYATICGNADDLLMYDSPPEEDFDDGPAVFRKYLTLLTEPASPTSRVDGPETACPLLNDCMWSAGMLPPDLMASASAASRPRDGTGLTAATSEDVDADTAVVCTAVDPSLVSPCPHLSQQSPTGARYVTLSPPSAHPGLFISVRLYSRDKRQYE